MVGRHAASVLTVVIALGGCQASPQSPAASMEPTGLPSASPTAASPTAASSPTLQPSTAPPTTAAPSPTPAEAGLVAVIPPNADAPDGGLGLAWSRAHDGLGHGTVIAHGPRGWATIVYHDGAPPTLFVSDDLRTWVELGLPSRPGTTVSIVAANERGYVLPVDGACLWSADARHWEETTGVAFGDVVSDGRRFVGWGSYPATDGVWASADGRSWSKVALPGAPAVLVDAVAARPGGGFVVAGRAGASEPELDAVEGPATLFAARPGRQAVWLSEDGFSWSAVRLGPGFEAARFTSVAAGGPGGGIVAVGRATAPAETSGVEPDLAVWRWTDDAGWRRLRGQGFPVVERDAGLTHAIATAARWLLLGARLRSGATSVVDTTSSGILAGSEDGLAWWTVGTVLLHAGSRDYSVDGIATEPGRILLSVNWSGPSLSEEHLEIWASPPVDGE